MLEQNSMMAGSKKKVWKLCFKENFCCTLTFKMKGNNMPRINVKLDDVEGGFELIPEGSYHVELQETSKITKAKTSGAPKIIWVSKIVDGEFEGKTFCWDTSLQEQALWNLKSMLEQIDVTWDEDGFDLEDCTYQKVVIDVIVEEYNGTPRNYVRGYHKA